MKHILDNVRPSFTTIHALALALAVTGGRCEGWHKGEERDCHPESHRTV